MATVSIHALGAGSLTLPERFFVTPADETARRTVPSLSFLIQHHSKATDKTTRIVFDLGMRRDISLYPPTLQKHCSTRLPISTQPDVVASLAKGGLTVNDIDYVIFSHVHYDHVGMPQDFSNPKTTFVVGPGALDLLNGKSQLNIGSHSHFEADLLPLDRTVELPPLTPSESPQTTPDTSSPLSKWSTNPLPPFEHTIDIFSDSSVYIVSAPGHLPGHINLLVRPTTTSLGSESNAILLAGDAFHDIRLFNGTHSIATWMDHSGTRCCIHADMAVANQTIERLRKLKKDGVRIPAEGDGSGQDKGNVEIVFAHDWEWEADAKARGRFFPGSL